MPPCAIAACLIEQALPDIFPDGMRPIVFDGIGLLDFDDPRTAHAFDSQHMARDFREPALLDRQWRPSSGAWIGQDRIPQFIGQRIAGARFGFLAIRLASSLPRQLFHLLWGGHSPACGSLIRHGRLEQIRNEESSR